MKWPGKLGKKLVRLAVTTTALTAIVVVLDAVLSPEEARRTE